MPTPAQRAWNKPPRHPNRHRRITPAQRDEIRRRLAAGETARALAAEYGVSRSTIYNCR
ncbi:MULTISPECIES: helix-turn-helix domain-containing protein [Streptomycetaceae]|uniref:Resolvase HTH domain-containing protein n=1 Tax=Streptantibioticus cattleyicolor (strain ATCC 35852 / DSM 46488 / JCM 4925 / NBRC 14057 / NRRL 8057) TaxID=1003195 RepID=F8JY59_STREN|nr:MULTISPECIES: helix-turn-helix domain-containing protein [Streptomycetaceae]AEW94635.1 hypothetical protein SCATT_22640 [Streptantibioticus cattleyicolor NRRL 8057 = DSM 46488]MYS59273.1 helix-turn-helix domain-containing protein [Streptomyces sp. SID5468]CCB74992.1 protein of unknown function [Streptantibioticus cattleyicolor NRRL 8057 = DSM 46488]